jgi:catechol 2,3-dioxygenase-like lactoylglutathione lyase family enzyme
MRSRLRLGKPHLCSYSPGHCQNPQTKTGHCRVTFLALEVLTDSHMPEEFKISFRRVNHVTVAVPAGEEEKVRAFYGGILGLKEVPQDKALVGHYKLIWYELLDILLHLDFSPPWVTPAENRHVALEVNDLEGVRAYLNSRGAEIRKAVPMADRNRFYLIDPFGNYFEFIELK